MAVNLAARYQNFEVGAAGLISALDGLTTFSISLWARHSNGDNDSDFCIWGTHGANPGGGWLFWRDESDTKFSRSNTLSALVGNDLRGVCVSDSWNDALWHHACLTVQAGSATGFHLYIDGVEKLYNQSSLAGFGGLSDPGVAVRFGDAIPNSGSSWMIGDLDDCRIYNRILSQNEVLSIATRRGTDDIIDGLLVRFTLDDKAPGQAMTGAAGEVRDSGPNGYDGLANDSGYPTYLESEILHGVRRRAA